MRACTHSNAPSASPSALSLTLALTNGFNPITNQIEHKQTMLSRFEREERDDGARLQRAAAGPRGALHARDAHVHCARG